jgi:hypothetical protein
MTPEQKVQQMKDELRAQQKSLVLKEALLEQQTLANIQQSNTDRQIAREQGDTKAAPYWAKVREKANEFVTPSGQAAYVEWSTSVMEMFASACDLSKALIYSNSAGRVLDFIWNKAVSTLDDIGEMYNGQSLGQALEQEVQKRIYKAKDSEIQPLKYSISVDTAGKLTTEFTKNGQPLPLEQQQLVDVGLIAWAEQIHHCQFDDTNQILTDEHGAVMTMDKLNELNQDDEKGLNAFFEGRLGLEISPHPSPAP